LVTELFAWSLPRQPDVAKIGNLGKIGDVTVKIV
jgi:hypothetical protein